MSTPERFPQRTPLLALVHRTDRVMQADMIREARRSGLPLRQAHTAVFGTLPLEGARAADLAAKAGITRQSMGEVVRELVELGFLEMRPDPHDRRAKLVTYTEHGLREARRGAAHIVDVEERIADELGEAAYEQLRTSLGRIVEMLAAGPGEDEPG